MTATTVSINGHRFKEVCGGYVPCSVEITEYLKVGENLLTVDVDATERHDIPPFGGRVDFLAVGGIYREVYLREVPNHFIEDVVVRTNQGEQKAVQTTVTVARVPERVASSDTIEVVIADQHGTVLTSGSAALTQCGGSSDTTVVSLDSRGLQWWSPESRTLYTARVSYFKDDRMLDSTSVTFGIRTAEFCKDGQFLLNGEPYALRGLNRHQLYPYLGNAAPWRLQRQDADIIRYQLGCTIVRTSHYPQSRHFLDRCDEIGLLVFEEIPGWQHLGESDEWKERCLQNVAGMIRRDRNRPSIVLWGVRINESPDDDSLYQQSNQLAKHLDPTRQTGGVRAFIKSSFLEDVFTFNDFSGQITPPVHTPHLISECHGHMFSTKPWDNEERRIEHALRYARLWSDVATVPGVSGIIGWCAFDYNTHREFGSGDRICYHGVMDIHRQPKLAARFFESQISPAERAVVWAATSWSVGEHGGGGVRPLVVFTNCDEVEVSFGSELFGRFAPDRAAYPNLAHPPVVIPGITEVVQWNASFGDLRVVGLRGGKQVAVHEVEGAPTPRAIQLEVDYPELIADGVDITRVTISVVDRYGNPIVLADRIVTIQLEGQEGATATVVGPSQLTTRGGSNAVFIRAGRTVGKVVVRAVSGELCDERVISLVGA
jgi:beta-galactosidase